jgi:hypothetical protein
MYLKAAVQAEVTVNLPLPCQGQVFIMILNHMVVEHPQLVYSQNYPVQYKQETLDRGQPWEYKYQLHS